MNFTAKIIASGLGSGFSPVAPGTAGSAVAALAVWLLAPWWGVWTGLGLAAVSFIVGVWACGRAEKDWGHDNGRMVIDEVAGMFLAASFSAPEPLTLVIAFFIFRLFDIVKPPPARQAESLPSGWGVMTDDMVAGIYALIVMWGIEAWM